MGFIKMFITVNKRAPWAVAHLLLDVFFAEKLEKVRKKRAFDFNREAVGKILPAIVITFAKIPVLETERFINMLSLRHY